MRLVSQSLLVLRTVGQHARTGRAVHASEQLHRHASPSFVTQGHSSRSPPAELGINAGSERSEGLGQGGGNPSSPRGDARPQRRRQGCPLRNASAFVLPPRLHSWRALAGTYRARQLGGPRSEVDHLPRSVHGARVRTASVRYRIERVVRATRSQAGTLPSSSAEPALPLARAAAGSTPIGSLNEARIPIGHAFQPRPVVVAPPRVYCFNPFF